MKSYCGFYIFCRYYYNGEVGYYYDPTSGLFCNAASGIW